MRKERTLARTSSSVACDGDVIAGRRITGRSDGGAGCLWRSSSRVLLSIVAEVEDAGLRAHVASSSLAVITATFVCSPLGPCRPFPLVDAVLSEKRVETKSAIC